MSKIIYLQPWSTVLSLCEINLFMPSFNIYYVTVGVSGANTLRERECLPIRVNIEPELLQKTEPPPLLTAIKHSSFPERFESRLCPLPTELFWRFYSFIWKKKMGKGTVSERMLWEFNEITLSDSPKDPWHQEIYHFLNPLIRSYIPWVQPSTASQLRCSVYCSFLILNPHDNPIDTGNPTWQVWKLRKWFMTLGIQSQDCIRKWLQPPGTTARLSEFKSQLHYLLVI